MIRTMSLSCACPLTRVTALTPGQHARTTANLHWLVCAAGAVFMAGEQYGEEVRVIDVPGVSMELCGGTHVTQTAQIGAFKILSESGIASGVRRVEAVAGPAAVDHMNGLDSVVRAIGKQLKAKNEDLPARVSGGRQHNALLPPSCNHWACAL